MDIKLGGIRMNTQEKLDVVTKIANEEFDGHFSLMKFTTNWGFTFGTVADREDIDYAVKGKTLDEVLDKAIESKNSVHDGSRLSDVMNILGVLPKDKDWEQLTED